VSGARRLSIGDRIVAWLAARRLEATLRHVRGRLLDFGCGDNQLVRRHGNGVGVDVLQWGDVDLVVEDTGRLPLDSGAFDTISFVACLNHIPNREEVLDEAHRLLAPDGRVVATMIPPRLSAIWHWLIRPWDPDQHGRHLHEGEVWGITNAEMRRLFERHGFVVERHERFEFGLNNLFVARKA
jgi:SAM-dependent methyltransferase